VALLGHPIGHSRSKELFDALAGAGGPEVRYEPVDVPPERLEEVLADLRRGRWHGANVTIPHKTAVVSLADGLDASAAAAGAANVLQREAAGALVAVNTDGIGFLRGLERLPAWADRTVAWTGRRVVVLGGGGAARGVCAALREAGAAVTLVTRAPAERSSWRPGLAGEVLGWDDAPGLAQAIEASSLIVQATPLGMSPHEEGCAEIPFERLGAGHTVVDLVYNPWRTRFLERAAAAGARTLNGWPMLVRQAAAALDLWAGAGAGDKLVAVAQRVEQRDPVAG
jgi:shikimate dehydrogenase